MRADRRAALLRNAGFENVPACVDGDTSETAARGLAARMKVESALGREVSPAA